MVEGEGSSLFCPLKEERGGDVDVGSNGWDQEEIDER